MTMSAIAKFLISLFVIAAILGAGCTQPAAVQSKEPPGPALAITVPVPPIPVPSRDGVNLAYELELAPSDGQIPVVEKVEVINPASGNVVYTENGDLLAAMYHPASVPPPTPEERQNGTTKLTLPRISVWFVVSPDTVPDNLTHRITLNRTVAGLPSLAIRGGDVVVRKDLSPVVVGSPLKGQGWLAMETTAPDTHHFRAQITFNSVTRVPQKYAQDFIRVDPVTGQAASGNATLARNYYGWGKELLAVADATVADAHDGIADYETIYSADKTPVNNAAGNYVILDLGNKKYACYAHMVNGSIRVKPGDTVKEGQVLGLMGNSGNSDIPHLHFQVVTDNPAFLASEGYPHVYRSFDVIGGVNQTRAMERQSAPGYTINQLWSEFGRFVEFEKTPVPQQGRLPENNAIVRFF
jgi:murein DD-endopeptidase MepM/ murein hydrolase activator NlpD